MTPLDDRSLGDLLRPIGASWRLVLACAALGAVVSALLVQVQPTSYVSRATVHLAQGATQLTYDPATERLPTLTVDTDAQLLFSDEVLQALATASGTDIDTASRNLALKAPPLSTTLQITYRAPTPDAAEAGAAAAAEALITLRSEILLAPRLSTAEQLRTEVARSAVALSDPSVPLGMRNGIAVLTSEVNTDLDELESPLLQQSFVVGASQAVRDDNSMIGHPYVSSGLAAGILVGVVLAWWRDRRREPPAAPDGCRAQLLTDSLRHHRGLVVLGAMVFGVAGGLAGYAASPSPSATATVTVQREINNAYSPDDPRNSQTLLQNEAQIAQSEQVLEAAAARVAPDLSVPRLDRRTAVTVPSGSTALKIRVRANTATKAEALATAIAEEYIAYRSVRADEGRASRSQALSDRSETLGRQLDTYLRANEDGRYAAQIAVYGIQLAQTQAELEKTLGSVGDRGTLLGVQSSDPASLATALLGAFFGLLMGALIGVVLAVFVERGRDRIRHEQCIWNYGLQTFSSEQAVRFVANQTASEATSSVALLSVGTPPNSRLRAFANALGDAGLRVVQHDTDKAPRAAVVALALGLVSHGDLRRAAQVSGEHGTTILGVVVLDERTPSHAQSGAASGAAQ